MDQSLGNTRFNLRPSNRSFHVAMFYDLLASSLCRGFNTTVAGEMMQRGADLLILAKRRLKRQSHSTYETSLSFSFEASGSRSRKKGTNS